MNEKKEKALVPRQPSAVEKATSGVKRILSGMVSDTLALASRDQRSLATTKFRIGNFEWCEPDYRQILIWAEETGLMPEEVTTRLFDQQSLCKDRFGQPMTEPYFDGPLFLDGRLLRVNWDLKLLRCNRIEWVNGLEIIGIRFIGASNAASLSDIGALPLARLKWLICHRVGLTHLDLSRLPALRVLGCSENRLEKLQLHSSAQLTHLFCGKNMLAELEVSQTSKLRVLHCADNAISELDLSSCQNLEKVNCSKNPIRVLDIRGLKHLRVLSRSPHTRVIMDPDQEHLVQNFEAQAQGLQGKKEIVTDQPPVQPKKRRGKLSVCIDDFGEEGPECFIEGTVIYINQQHPYYQREAKKPDAYLRNLTRLVTHEISLIKDLTGFDGLEAYVWFKLAAEQGNLDAAQELARLISSLSPDELQEGDRRYREFKASH